MASGEHAHTGLAQQFAQLKVLERNGAAFAAVEEEVGIDEDDGANVGSASWEKLEVKDAGARVNYRHPIDS